MQTQIKSWGNSQAIRLAKELLEIAGMKANEEVNIEACNGQITISKSFKHKTLEERAAEYNGRLNLNDPQDWGEPTGREIW
ncbi:MAG: AbrB/MazE/SpoVT family DNA-binding domain-containing protein [Clostridiales bacterium]|nr:AbrB/MazE/SpoVT family DNA-binding domain-containing protein [Candidatus Crickella equi]